jgi:hypothetical protein
MIFRISEKLNTKIKAGTLATLPLDENPFADWSAALFQVDRKQHILVTNTKSLYSTLLTGKGITDKSSFVESVLSSILLFLEADGYMGVYDRLIAPVRHPIAFAKSLNRSITGSMNDLIKHATFYLRAADDPLFGVAEKLNETPMSGLKQDGSVYGFPTRVFSQQVESGAKNQNT